MTASKWAGLAAAAVVATLSGCGATNPFGGAGSLFDGGDIPDSQATGVTRESRQNLPIEQRSQAQGRSTIFDLFGTRDDPNVTLEVNRYLWSAALEVLDFLPVETADPFSGVIVFGYGTPPGGGRAYRATVHVQDPAMDARSLRVALASRSGPVATDTVRAVEDAILTRARQLRQRDSRL